MDAGELSRIFGSGRSSRLRLGLEYCRSRLDWRPNDLHGSPLGDSH